MEKIQQEFEAWLKSGGNLTMKEDDGKYSFQHTRFALEAWKASRVALCIELPDSKDDYQSSSYFEEGWLKGFNNCLSEAQDALDQAGVSYK